MTQRYSTRITSALAVAGFAAAILVPSAALAKPDKPITAATTESGTGCLVRDADGAYHLDEACTWHLTSKTDADGNITLYHYQDKGTLPADAPHPSKADKVSFEGGCSGTENTKPSGKYSSDCKYNVNADE